MVETKNIGLGIFMVLSVVLSGLYVNEVQDDDYSLFKCEERDLVGNCFKLSATKKSCYYDKAEPNRYKRCTGGWESISLEPVLTGQISPFLGIKSTWYTKSPGGDKCYNKGNLQEEMDCANV